MGKLRWASCALLVAALAIPLAACGAVAGAPGADTPTALTSSPDTESTSSPPTEATGTEKPLPTEDEISIAVPTLPIGGDTDDSGSVQQCVRVSWLGDDDVPEGVSVAVAAVTITPGGVFDRSGSGCGGEPACDHFAFTADRPTCSVSITAKGTDGKVASLVMRGTAECAAGQQEKCADLVASVKGQSIQLQQPEQEQPPPSSETTTETPTTETPTT